MVNVLSVIVTLDLIQIIGFVSLTLAKMKLKFLMILGNVRSAETIPILMIKITTVLLIHVTLKEK